MKKFTVMALMLFALCEGRAQMSNETVIDYGRLWDVSYDLEVEDKMYALTLNNHIVVSYNNGTTWDILYAYPNDTATLRNLKVLSDEVLCFSVQNLESGNGIYYYNVQDGEIINTIPLPGGDNEIIESFAVAGEDFSTLLVGVVHEGEGDKVYYTSTSGENWDEVYDSNDYNNVAVNAVAINPEDASTIYIARSLGPEGVIGGLFISENSGETWTEKLPGIGFASIDINPFDSDDIILGTMSPFEFEQNMHRSFDGGDTWEALPIEWSDDDFQAVLIIKFHPTVEGIIFALEDNEIIYTNTNGTTWTNTLYTDTAEYHYGLSLSINPFDTKEAAIGTNYYPIHTSNGGVTVTQIKAPYAKVDRVYATKFDDTEHLYYMIQGGYAHKNYETGMSSDYDTVSPDMIGGGSQMIADPSTEGRIFIYSGGFMGNTLSVSTDHGATKTGIFNDFVPVLKTIAVNPDNNNIIYAGLDDYSQGLMYKLDITDVNAVINTPITLPDVAGAPLRDILVIDGETANAIFIAKGNKVYTSVDEGLTWTEAYTAESAFAVNDIAVNPFNSDNLAIATDSGIYISEDAGETWAVSLEDAFAGKVKFSDVEDGIIVAGVYSGGPENAYITYYNGLSWVIVGGEELNYQQCYSMDFNFFGDNIHAYISTVDCGVFRYIFEIDETAGVTDPVGAANTIILYPNPASGIVNVKGNGAFDITNIALYNVTGQKVLEAASATVDVSSLSNGVYVVKAQTSNGSYISKKLVKQ